MGHSSLFTLSLASHPTVHCPKANRFSTVYHEMLRGKRDTIRGIFDVVSRIPLHFMLYRENYDYFLNSV